MTRQGTYMKALRAMARATQLLHEAANYEAVVGTSPENMAQSWRDVVDTRLNNAGFSLQDAADALKLLRKT